MVYIPKRRRVWHFMTLGLCVACGIFAAPRAWSQPVTFSIPSNLQIVSDDAEFEAAKRAVDDLREALLHAKPVIDLQTGFYHDSDRNNVFNNQSSLNLSLSNIELNLLHTRSDALGPVGYRVADQAMAGFSAPLSEIVSVVGGVGISRMDGSLSPIGHLETNADLGKETASLSAAREALVVDDTTIKYGIMVTNLGVSGSYSLAEALLLSLDYHYKNYSDHNQSNEVQFSLGHSFALKWSKLNLGWKFNYADFARETHHGYYDPSNLFAYQPFADWSFDRGAYYADAELSFGHQSDRYTGQNSSDFTGSGSGTFGVRLSKATSMEINAEGGNYALGTMSTGWNYFSTSLRVNHAF